MSKVCAARGYVYPEMEMMSDFAEDGVKCGTKGTLIDGEVPDSEEEE